MEMQSDMVIKVRYGDTLRRFNAAIKGDGQLALDLKGLRAKVLGLFNLPADAAIKLTYIDEDGDVVTLVEDYDLQDVTRQNLKFLRVDVTLQNSFAAASGSSTPLRSPSVQNGSIADLFYTLPPQLHESVSKLSQKAAASGSRARTDVAAGVADALKTLPPHLCDAVSKISNDLASKIAAIGVPEKTGSSSHGIPVIPDLVESLSKIGFSYIGNNQPSPQAVSDARAATVPTAPPQEDLAKSSSAASGKSAPRIVNIEKGTSSNSKEEPSAGINGPMSANTCPFSGMPMASRQSAPPPYMELFKRCHSRRNDGTVGLFHRGVQCDGCGMHPIAGPRYKSKVKENYDLCGGCFAEIGAEADYVKMDKPMSYRQSRSHRGWTRPAPVWLNPHQAMAQLGSVSLPKLDSRFISDVNVMDGTIIAPSTPFTKIWRLRNNGGLVWPQGTQLVWIGGDRFSLTDVAELEIPKNGLPLEAELDIAIDFTSPALPGRYVSYWRAASPSGTKFGQRIWVIIQVDASLKVSSAGLSGDFNLNFPPLSAASIRPDSGDLNGKAVVDDFPPPSAASIRIESSNGKVVLDQEKNFPVNDSLLVGRASPTVSYPMIDLNDVSATLPTVTATPSVTVPAASEAVGMEVDDNDVETTLLKELEEMGFKQVNRNKEVLRMNEYNLEQSLDDLCNVGEWDPILVELEEMGFSDKEMNKKLLQKNNGSIKRVVMDILTGEKA